MQYGEYAKYPCCGKIAYDKDEIERNSVIEIWVMIK